MKKLLIILVALLWSNVSIAECIEGDCINGYGTFTYVNGDIYVGEFKYGERKGQGTYTYASGEFAGDKYVGEFKYDKYNGQGAYTWADGEKYVGKFKDDEQHGQGTFTYADGSKYVGEFKDGKRNGQGTFTYASGEFAGDKYVGEWKEGKRHGQGTYTRASGEFAGSKYVGEFKDDKRHGQGTLTGKDGSKYVGEFKDDKRNGQGTNTRADGSTYDGLWISDKTELNEREIDLKHVSFPIKENWDENWLNKNLMIAPKSIHQYPMQVSQVNFEPKKIRFNINQSINGVSISGILIPREILDILSTSWGSAIVKFTRIKDGKFFEIYARKIIFDDSKNVCQGLTDEKITAIVINFETCKLSSDEPMKIDNNIIWGSTFSFKDIDYDGEEELIVNEKLATRVGSDYIAYNIINTKHDFRIDERNPISVVYNDRGDFIEDKKLLINQHNSGCCNWITYTWKAEKGSYELIEIEDNLD